MLSSYAVDPKNSRGRLFLEDSSPYRSHFQRDRDRIIHSSAFRRLKHKTQVFVAHGGDYFRTRLTHSIEVGQIGRTISGALGLNIDLTEAIALAHDLGHTPFGHTGEEALNGSMASFGGFDHNSQAIRVVTELEKHYARFDGLNLTWETLEGIAKHNGPLTSGMKCCVMEYNNKHNLELGKFASCEAQVASIADDIAYTNHDLSDGLRAGLFSTKDLRLLPIVGDCFKVIESLYPNIEEKRKWHESLRRVFNMMVEDVLYESRDNLKPFCDKDVDSIRMHSEPVLTFSSAFRKDIKEIKTFLFERMYRHSKVNKFRLSASRLIKEMFEVFFTRPDMLPEEWRKLTVECDEIVRARIVADYIAGMTDQYALMEYRRLTKNSNYSL